MGISKVSKVSVLHVGILGLLAFAAIRRFPAVSGDMAFRDAAQLCSNIFLRGKLMRRKHIRVEKQTINKMNACLLRWTIPIAVVCSAAVAFSQNLVAPAPSSGGATSIYRQVTPDGRVIYSDKMLDGARLDRTITVGPSINGNSSSTESGSRPIARQQVEPTPSRQVDSPLASGNRKSLDEAASDVIRAEMLLDDAKKRQQRGVEPLPGERTGNKDGYSRLNEMYWARQELLANDVAIAEALLKEAAANRDRLR